MKKIILLIVCFACFSESNFAQGVEREVVATAGDYYAVRTAGLSWTLGEVMVENYSKNRYASLSQGFHQKATRGRVSFFSFLSSFFNAKAVQESNEIDVDIDEEVSSRVYPNPTSDYVNIDLSDAWESDVIVVVYDMFGRIVYEETMNDIKTTQIDMSALSNGFYILQIKSEKLNIIKTNKINKIN